MVTVAQPTVVKRLLQCSALPQNNILDLIVDSSQICPKSCLGSTRRYHIYIYIDIYLYIFIYICIHLSDFKIERLTECFLIIPQTALVA